jgi:hypothetical protein
MRLGVKHSNQNSVVRADFSGGLNTAAAIEGIAENQLAECVNMEIDHSTGRLKTVGGTVDVLLHDNIFAVVYDSINSRFLVVLEDKTVHLATMQDGTIGESLGTLTGDLFPVYTAWEDGVLIASGGKLQYYNGTALVTIDSPTAQSVYIRAGRVVITDNNNVRYSGVGDETNWTEDTGDPSTSKWVEAGYKDGGNFLGMASLSSNIVIIKDNRRVYRLSGEFPDWSIAEVSRNVECIGRRSFCSVANAVFILGKNEVSIIQTTDEYGDVKPSNAATLVTKEIQKLPANALVRYVPPLSQVWFIGDDGTVLMYDLAGQSWFMRQFNSPVVDVISVGDNVYVVKSNRIAKIDDSTFYDDNLPLVWSFKAQRLVSQHDFLLKRTQISVIPKATEIYSGEISCGAVVIDLPMPAQGDLIIGARSLIWNNRAKISRKGRSKGVYSMGEMIYRNTNMIYGNGKSIFEPRTIIKESRNVFRSKFIDVKGSGAMGGFVLNSIIMDIAEV